MSRLIFHFVKFVNLKIYSGYVECGIGNLKLEFVKIGPHLNKVQAKENKSSRRVSFATI